MITDPLFYRLFETSPETLFLLLGMSPEAAVAMAARYQFQAIEFKETAHRTDGVFLPKEPELPLYILEVQFYPLPSVYADLLAKAYTYLKQHDPGQPFCGVVLFGDRSFEPIALAPYQPLLDAGMIRRFFVEELPDLADAPLGLSILNLIRQSNEQAPAAASDLIVRAKAEIDDAALRTDLIQLIETVILYKLPRLSREEVEAMLKVQDLREIRVCREMREEGKEEGREETIAFAIVKLASKGMPAEEIASTLELDVAFVRQVIATSTQKPRES
jgi:predicted transposase/invertase (TIGR01784 family)